MLRAYRKTQLSDHPLPQYCLPLRKGTWELFNLYLFMFTPISCCLQDIALHQCPIFKHHRRQNIILSFLLNGFSFLSSNFLSNALLLMHSETKHKDLEKAETQTLEVWPFKPEDGHIVQLSCFLQIKKFYSFILCIYL